MSALERLYHCGLFVDASGDAGRLFTLALFALCKVAYSKHQGNSNDICSALILSSWHLNTTVPVTF
jgi:hypothetical protein